MEIQRNGGDLMNFTAEQAERLIAHQRAYYFTGGTRSAVDASTVETSDRVE